MHVTPENIVFTSKNVDRAGQTTNLIFVVGKNGSGFSDVVREVSPWKLRLSQIHTPNSIVVFPYSSQLNENIIVVWINFYLIL